MPDPGPVPAGGLSAPAAADAGPAAPDLDARARVHDLVVHFYREIVFDPVLDPVFEEVAEVDWSVHIPRLVDYWCRVLLGHTGYDGMILAAHRHVHDRQAFEPVLFDRWYELWVASVDAGWAGPKADLAKAHAARIMAVLAHQLCALDWSPPVP